MSSPTVASSSQAEAYPQAEVPARTETVEACPLCDSRRLRLFARSADRMYRLDPREFEYSSCGDCGLVFQSFRPIESDIGKFYPTDYLPYQNSKRTNAASRRPLAWIGRQLQRVANVFGDLVLRAMRWLSCERFNRDYREVYRRPAVGASLLDFGCGSDKFLNRARKLGWQTTGADFSQLAVESARSSGHRAVLLSPETWDELENESFDFIRLNHVVEHLYNPRDVLTRLRQKLKPGGCIELATPNPGCASAWLFGRHWYPLESPRHIMLYTPQRAHQLLTECGFADVRILHESMPKDAARSVVYSLQPIGLASQGMVKSIIHNRLLAMVLYLPVRLGAIIGQGERIHIVGRRPHATSAAPTGPRAPHLARLGAGHGQGNCSQVSAG